MAPIRRSRRTYRKSEFIPPYQLIYNNGDPYPVYNRAQAMKAHYPNRAKLRRQRRQMRRKIVWETVPFDPFFGKKTGKSYDQMRAGAMRRAFLRKRTISPRGTGDGYLSKFKRAFKRKVDLSFEKYGSVMQYEDGGIIEDTQAVYIGHSTGPTQSIAHAVCRTIIRQLAIMAGQPFDNWDQRVVAFGTTSIFLNYSFMPDATASALAITQLVTPLGSFVGVPWSTMATDLYTSFVTNLGGTPSIWQLYAVWLYSADAVTSDGTILATIRPKQLRLSFSIYSTLLVQNETLAGTVSSPDIEDEATTNVTNNPLWGYRYEKNQSFFRTPTLIQGDDAANIVLYPNHIYGTMLTAANTYSHVQLYKPPKGFAFGTSRFTRTSLGPGQIKRSFIKVKQSMNLEDFIAKNRQVFHHAVKPEVMSFGACSMLGLEKALDNRQGENSIRIGWECNLTVKCKGYYSTVPPVIDGNTVTIPS